jgi:Asp-tRNA(Asn)/Glu-tRNA(Gln) amidotransferase A subunit family amidase
MCRTVEDVARVLDVIAGYDPADELTAYSIGRLASPSYRSFTGQENLNGIRIGVLREYMDKTLFTQADHESIDIVERAVGDLRRLGATIVDPGAGNPLFQRCIDQYAPSIENSLFTSQLPRLFPRDPGGKPSADHMPLLVEMSLNPTRVAELINAFYDPSLPATRPTIRNFGPAPTVGERKWLFNRYLRERGDANIRSVTDLIEKANFFTDIRPGSRFADKKAELEQANAALTLDLRDRMYFRSAVQQIVLQCMATIGVDVLVYPTGNIPPNILGAPAEPTTNGRAHQAWTLLGQQGFPAMTVPAGFTTHVYDRVVDKQAPGGTRLVGPVPAVLPVGVDFLGRPFDEPTVLRVASAYERATKHRVPPAAFGPISTARQSN